MEVCRLSNLAKCISSLKRVPRCFWFILIVGVIARFYRLGYWSLWLDEAMVAISLSEKSLSELLFQYISTNPLLFIVIEKCISGFLGSSEFALRLPSAISGSFLIIFVFMLCRQLVPKRQNIALLTSALIAFHPLFLRYSQELKVYIHETLFAIVLIWLTEAYCSKKCQKYTKQEVLLFLVTVIAILVSNSIVFLLPIIIARILFAARCRGDNTSLIRQYRFLFLYTFGVGIVFITYYLFYLQNTVSSDQLFAWWQRTGAFPADYSFLALAIFPIKGIMTFLQFLFLPPQWNGHFLGTIASVVLMAIFIYGATVMYKEKYRVALLYAIGPIIFILFASIASIFPFLYGRTGLFIVPLLFMIMVVGADTFLLQKKLMQRFINFIITACCIGLAIIGIGFYHGFGKETEREHLRPVVAYYQKNKQVGDVTMLYQHTNPAFRYYYGSFTGEENIHIIKYDGSQPGALREATSLIIDTQVGVNNRFWLIASHFDHIEHANVLRDIEKRCLRIDSIEDVEAGAYLFSC